MLKAPFVSKLCMIFLVLCTFTVQACAPKVPEFVKHYPECYEPIHQLRLAEAEYKKTIAKGVIIGLIGGSLVGAATGRSQNIIIGAAAGAIAGAIIGAAKATYDERAQENEIMARYLAEVDGQMSGLDGTTVAAKAAAKCYQERFQKAVADYKANTITKEQFSDQFLEIKNGLLEASTIMADIRSTAQQKEVEFFQTLNQEAQRAQLSTPQVPKVSRANRTTEKTDKLSQEQVDEMANKIGQYREKNQEVEREKKALDLLAQEITEEMNILMRG